MKSFPLPCVVTPSLSFPTFLFSLSLPPVNCPLKLFTFLTLRSFIFYVLCLFPRLLLLFAVLLVCPFGFVATRSGRVFYVVCLCVASFLVSTSRLVGLPLSV